MIRLFIFSLWLWGMVSLIFFLIALSDLAFTRKFLDFAKRAALCLIWPLAVFSVHGRETLFRIFSKTQERKQ